MWTSHEDRPEFRPFTEQLLDDPRTLLTLRPSDNGHFPALEWETFDQDSQVFAAVARLLWQTRQLRDQDFKESVHPRAAEILQSSELYNRLDSSDIQVTTAHQGVTPKRHTFQMVETTATDQAHLWNYQKFLVRLAAYYHDIGKGLSAGIPLAEVQLMMEQFQNPKHSYPNHDVLSMMVLQQFGRHPEVQAVLEELRFGGRDLWQMLLLMVRNHHYFEFEHSFDQAKAQLVPELAGISQDSLQLESFGLTFFLAYADLCSNPNYRHLWPEKKQELMELFALIKDEVWLQSPTLFFGLEMVRKLEGQS